MENEYNKKIKILHVAQAAGGVDRYLRTLLKYLDKDKFENIVVLSQDFKKEDYKDIADTFISIKMERAIGKHDIEAIKQLRKLIKKYAPDIVYAHSSKAGAIARVANIGMKNYCIYNPHGWAFNMQVSKKKQSLYTFIHLVAMLTTDEEMKKNLYRVCRFLAREEIAYRYPIMYEMIRKIFSPDDTNPPEACAMFMPDDETDDEEYAMAA